MIKGKKDKHGRGVGKEKKKLDVILSDRHTGPVSYQPEDLSSPLNFSWLMKRPDAGWTKKRGKKKKGMEKKL